MYQIVEHNCNSLVELKAVRAFLDNEIGTDYEADIENLTIIIFDLTSKEFVLLMEFLKKHGYVK